MAGNPRSSAIRARKNSQLADETAAQVAELFGLENISLMFDATNRIGKYVVARSLFWHVMSLRWKYSGPELMALSGFHHTTIREAILATSEQLKTDRDLQQKARCFGV